MIDWKKIRFTFDQPLYHHQRINAHILYTSGVNYDTRCGDTLQPAVRRAIMENLVRNLFHAIYGDMRKQLMMIRDHMMRQCVTAAEWDSVEKLFEPIWQQMEPPKLDEILREGTTRDGSGGTVLPSATPNPNPCTTVVDRPFVPTPRAFQPKRETTPSGSEAECYVDARKS